MAARWQRHDLSDASAACLDGSPAAFYFRPRVAATTNGTNAFVIFFEGGTVPHRLRSRRSHLTVPPSVSSDGTRNPGNGASYFSDIRSRLGAEFASSNLVHIKYCDGASFSGGGSVLSFEQLMALCNWGQSAGIAANPFHQLFRTQHRGGHPLKVARRRRHLRAPPRNRRAA